ncbi:hypothetical protein [Leptospira borgpetersenii]|uniref:Uncharacterized protein n=1 Tax=Leptospira borgpetersenii serovar Ballum TaxID=280505 RepID=A0A0E3B9C8_LEPBO|nr:hypothetical protein [Leptospira borgpetersenii]ALO24895.1 hypothetical protein LBBP_00547 [Leptospira borgpetersenii serovar Ballum]ANG99943.1 Uncharacterized protein LB4E_0443 [Leptospira borgpetersenii str. 4E]EKR02092.1 hypothetical protein LEP1GSC121_0841 [Leptospira borgpetersenii serovar Castellonis str. 200801910]KGE24972.1 hypothetical protein IQ66_05630 [Leptospira borgpetersenii serovar Ballum]MBE8160854.1 hypothetical protein [Leptospira borgpetersenii serovar Ballum]
MSEFPYDFGKFRKNLIFRSIAVVLLYFVFIVWNFLKVPEENRTDFVKIFGLLSVVLGFLLYRNFSRQLRILKGAKVELTSNSLRLFNSKGQSLETKLKSIVSIERDVFRSYVRFLIATKEDLIPVLNLLEPDLFQSELEKNSGKKAIVQENRPGFFHPKTLLYFIPSLIMFGAVFYEPLRLKMESFYLIANINALLVAIYFPEDKVKLVYSAKRRWIFLLGALLIAQCLIYLRIL